MCGRCACTLEPDRLQEACAYLNPNFMWTKPEWIKTVLEYKPFYNGGPTTTVPVLTRKDHFTENNIECNTNLVLVPMRWSLAANWTPKNSQSYQTHNARLESLESSNLYKPCLEKGQTCVVVADGYYEWQTTENTKKRQPYYLYNKPFIANRAKEKWHDMDGWSGRNLIKMAGIFNYSKEDQCYTCSIVTTESNDTLSWLHHRMPLLLSNDLLTQLWLDKNHMNSQNRASTIEKVMKNFANNKQFIFHPVDSAFVNKSSCNDPKCVEPVVLKKEKTLDSWLKK